MTTIGELGEQIVSRWLAAQGWTILSHRWRCRWGEIDLIVQPPPSEVLIVFIEVKTRSGGNWDADGILAITSQKQAKLSRTAASFLAQYPALATLPCRFDVALVSYKPLLNISPTQNDNFPLSITMGQPFFWQGYQFTLHNYIAAAFDGDAQY